MSDALHVTHVRSANPRKHRYLTSRVKPEPCEEEETVQQNGQGSESVPTQSPNRSGTSTPADTRSVVVSTPDVRPGPSPRTTPTMTNRGDSRNSPETRPFPPYVSVTVSSNPVVLQSSPYPAVLMTSSPFLPLLPVSGGFSNPSTSGTTSCRITRPAQPTVTPYSLAVSHPWAIPVPRILGQSNSRLLQRVSTIPTTSSLSLPFLINDPGPLTQRVIVPCRVVQLVAGPRNLCPPIPLTQLILHPTSSSVSTAAFQPTVNATAVVPFANTATDDDDAPDDTVLWGRPLHLPNGNLHFLGVDSHSLPGPSTLVRRLLGDPLALKLPTSTMDFKFPLDKRSTAWLDDVFSGGSRKGFHVCLACDQAFTSPIVYNHHMLRPVACVIYECHLCMQRGVATNNVEPSPFFRVSSVDGTIHAPNRCAVYAHFAVAHPDARADWRLVPEALVVRPLSTWTMIESLSKSTCAEAGESALQRVIQQGPSEPSSFYRSERELDEIRRSLESAINETVSHRGVTPLEATTRHLPTCGESSLSFVDSPMCQLIRRSARLALWKTHVFLSDWCQSAVASGDSSSSSAVVSSSGEAQNVLNPPAPALVDFLTSLARDPPSSLRCSLCPFRCDSAAELVEHLCGPRPPTSTQCAMCTQPVAIRLPELCSVKAHVLLHLGCYVMCPECGYTPPPFLPPEASEVCLRLHLRFVCFHYNLVQVFVCCLCELRRCVFNTRDQLIAHLIDMHARRIYTCLRCSRPDDRVTGQGHSADGEAPAPAPKFQFCWLNKMVDHLRIQHNIHPPRRGAPTKSDLAKTLDYLEFTGVEFLTCFPCNICEELFDSREKLVQHFKDHHSADFARVTCYRCFGSCNHLAFTLPAFRQHVSSCAIAVELLRATFVGYDTFKQLPFYCCPYCCVYGYLMDKQLVEYSVMEPVPSVSTSSLPGTRVPSPVAPTPSRQPPFFERYTFCDLQSLHSHEACTHLTENPCPAACPWCNCTLSCSTFAEIQETRDHLKTHLNAHNYAKWHLQRRIRWQDDPQALPLCSCGSAVLDSPLSVLSHSASHLLTSSPVPSSHEPRGPRDLPKPGPSPHIPCPTSVYRHLRFAVQATCDDLLSKGIPFTCPLCESQFPTRWALTEHAFVEHWGMLCFICCTFSCDNHSTDPSSCWYFWTHVYQCIVERSRRLQSPRCSMSTETESPRLAIASTCSGPSESHEDGNDREPSTIVIMSSSDESSPQTRRVSPSPRNNASEPVKQKVLHHKRRRHTGDVLNHQTAKQLCPEPSASGPCNPISSASSSTGLSDPGSTGEDRRRPSSHSVAAVIRSKAHIGVDSQHEIFRCGYCGRTYVSRSGCRMHLSKVHGVKNASISWQRAVDEQSGSIISTAS